MKAWFARAALAAILFLMSAPFAAALELQGRTTVPGAGDPVPDPNDVLQRQNLSDRQAVTRGMTSLGTAKIGNTTIHFGASRPGMFDRNYNSPFLDSPAARTVPSQR
jgi:hypothetical protein